MRKNPPESMQHHLRQRLNDRAGERWPQLARIHVRFRAGFAYVDGELKDGERLPLCRLRFAGVVHTWGMRSIVVLVVSPAVESTDDGTSPWAVNRVMLSGCS